MKGMLYIVPADVNAPVERREISAPPSGQDLHEIVGGYIEVVPGFTSVFVDREDRRPCAAFCNEDAKRPPPAATNTRATAMWQHALMHQGHPGLGHPGLLLDYLVGNIAIVTGDAELMEAL